MTDQTHGSVLTNAPVPNPIVDAMPAGTVVTDPAAIAAVLEALKTKQDQPMRFAGEPEGVSSDNMAATVTEAELRHVVDEKPTVQPKPPMDIPETKGGGAPFWAVVPPDMVFPRGRPTFFLRFNAKLTYTPAKGIIAPDDGLKYRHAIFWPMSVGDKKMAASRSMGDAIRFSDEMVKSCIRAIDGVKVDMGNAELDMWWDQVGEKVRGLLHRVFAQAHYLTPSETSDFLERCIESRSAG